MKQVVKTVTKDRPYDSQYGTFYVFKIEMADGTVGEYHSKSENQTKFVPGQEVDFEMTERQYNGTAVKRFKPINPDFQGNNQRPTSNKFNPEREALIVKQNALTNACNIVGEDDVNKILDIAEIFSNWVLKGDKPATTTKTDLPF